MKRFVAAALLFFPGIAQAEYFDTGNDLWGLCTDNFPGHKYLCLGLPVAYYDMMLATGYRCVATGSREQVRDVVLKYLTDNPDKRNLPASELAMTSLTAAFQCVAPAPAPVASPAKPMPRSDKTKAGAKGGPLLITPDH